VARARRRRRTHRQSFRELVGLWIDLFRRHDLLTYASAIAFQLLVAAVALTLLALGVLHAVGRTDVWTNQTAPQIEPKVLLPVFSGIDATVQKIFHSSSTGLIVFAAAVTIWEMSGVVRATMGAIERIYEEPETRPRRIRLPISIALAIALTVAIVAAILLTTAAKGAAGGVWQWPVAIGRWLLAVVLIAVAFGLLVRYAPAKPRTTRWASGGATLVVAGWVAQSLIFAAYLSYVANWKTAPGSLLGVYFLTTFLYVAAIILLVGIELDELLRKDLEGAEERGILEIVRDVV
jgi:membrane protein